MSEEPKKAGRPRKQIAWEQFEKLCELHCTQSEIASFFHVHTETLRDAAIRHYGDDYSTIYKRYLENGNCSLRRDQRVIAKKNATMAIWLGKQYLGQKDLPDQQLNEQALTQFNALMAQLLRLQAAAPVPQSSSADFAAPSSHPPLTQPEHVESNDKIIDINSNTINRS